MRSFITALIVGVGVGLASGGTAAAQETTSTTTTSTAATPPPQLTVVTPPPAAPTTTTAAVVPSASQGSLDLPAPDRTTSPINRPLMITSVILLGGTYAASAIDAATSTRDADKNNLYYPIVGPWMDYANRGGCPASGSCGGETGNKALLILDGVGQGLGVIGLVTSLFLPEKSTRNWFLIGSSGIHAAPTTVGTGYGFGARGTF